MFGLGALAYLGNKRAEDRREEEAAYNTGMENQRWDLLQQGLAEGRQRGEQMTGQTLDQTGADVQDIISRRREMVNAPSRAENATRSAGQNQARRARMGGASDAQQRQIQMDTERMAGLQGDMDYERRLSDFSNTVSGVMGMQSALEPAYAQLYLGSQYLNEPSRDRGIIGDMISGLGL